MQLNRYEMKLLGMIRRSTDPAEAAKIAFEIILQAISGDNNNPAATLVKDGKAAYNEHREGAATSG